MNIQKQEIDLYETNKQVIEQLHLQQAKLNNPINQFFEEFQSLQKKIKEQNEQIIQQSSDIHFFKSQHGLQDKYSIMKKQITSSELRCINLQLKLEKLQGSNILLNSELRECKDQNEALKVKNQQLELFLREYEKKIQDYESFDNQIKNSGQKNNMDEKLCNNCSQIKSSKRQQSLDLASSFLGENFLNNSMSLTQKSQSQESNYLKSQIDQNLSKTTINKFDKTRTMERSVTAYNINSESVFETDIRLARSHSQRAECKSDKILNNLKLSSYKKALKCQDCSIFQIEESFDQSQLAIINGKAEVKVIDSFELREFQQLSNINSSVTEAIKYSTKNNLLISGGQDKCVAIYQYSNSQQYKIKAKLLGHHQTVKAVQFLKNKYDQKIVSGSQDQTIRIWDVQAENQSHFVRVSSKVNTVDTFNFSDQIICGHNDGSIKLVQNKDILNTLFLEGPCVTHVQVSSDDYYALATNQDGLQISLIDLRMFKILHNFQNINYLNSSNYNKPTFAFHDKYIVAGSNDGDLCKLNIQNIIQSPYLYQFIKINLKCNLNNISLLTKKIDIWSLDDKICPPSVIQTQKNVTIHSTLYSSSSQKLFTADSKGNINIWKYE